MEEVYVITSPFISAQNDKLNRSHIDALYESFIEEGVSTIPHIPVDNINYDKSNERSSKYRTDIHTILRHYNVRIMFNVIPLPTKPKNIIKKMKDKHMILQSDDIPLMNTLQKEMSWGGVWNISTISDFNTHAIYKSDIFDEINRNEEYSVDMVNIFFPPDILKGKKSAFKRLCDNLAKSAIPVNDAMDKVYNSLESLNIPASNFGGIIDLDTGKHTKLDLRSELGLDNL
jgi:hypothetical protein